MSIGKIGVAASLFVAALSANTVVPASASAQAVTQCVEATHVKEASGAHFTGAYNNPKCTEPSATHEGKWELLANLTPEEAEALRTQVSTLQAEAEALRTRVSTLQAEVASRATKFEMLCGFAEAVGLELAGEMGLGAKLVTLKAHSVVSNVCRSL
jgi:uncharacterized protein YlxW (UPF0749 family)